MVESGFDEISNDFKILGELNYHHCTNSTGSIVILSVERVQIVSVIPIAFSQVLLLNKV